MSDLDQNALGYYGRTKISWRVAVAEWFLNGPACQKYLSKRSHLIFEKSRKVLEFYAHEPML
jgi:hypothetical protein